MSQDNNINFTALIMLAVIALGGIVYSVYETGEEITCRTGNGWTVLEDNGVYYSSVCKYKTKYWVYADCSEFRATKVYERYGCKEVIIVEKNIYSPAPAKGNYLCSSTGCMAIT